MNEKKSLSENNIKTIELKKENKISKYLRITLGIVVMAGLLVLVVMMVMRKFGA